MKICEFVFSSGDYQGEWMLGELQPNPVKWIWRKSRIDFSIPSCFGDLTVIKIAQRDGRGGYDKFKSTGISKSKRQTSYLCYTATQAYPAHASSKLCEAIFSQKVLYLSSFLACLIASGCWRPACCSSQYSLQMALLL